MCSFLLPIIDSDFAKVVSKTEELRVPGLLMAVQDLKIGALFSVLVSSKKVVVLGFGVKWAMPNGDVFHSKVSNYESYVHLGVLADAVRQPNNSTCEIRRVEPISDSANGVVMASLDCAFPPEKVLNTVLVAVTKSLHLQEQEEVALRHRTFANGSSVMDSRTWAAEITIKRPLMNLILLVIGAVAAFAVNKTTAALLSSRADVTHLGFHMVRELLGHDTRANPLQHGKEQEQDQRVTMQRFVCINGESAHVGFMEGDGDRVVQHLENIRHVACCSQIACEGRRLVRPNGLT
ncbi:hypothetical protein BWQ96_08515 [Gracilariopsis chorda]|uniref:Uncharacterized protein n=1 Tax=Gracilariopsis chorda TaxID=448386 RepID=A0A2V3II31_9FLOR|nr:hypothetical protein BWQ96_08515 [Gracilariopsis chorda]|eukprot:PXF41765.1 hypothetical protein BWQ96_08515 [Gracilariopsis chorda]